MTSDVWRNGSWLKAFRDDNGKLIHTLSGSRWGGIEGRCSEGVLTRQPSYVGCTNEFQSFNEFVEWSKLQKGYDMFIDGKMYAIDKDLLGCGKVYHPDVCVFVPQSVNSFLNLNPKSRGELPLGVTRHRDKYKSQIRVGNGTLHICVTDDPMYGHRAWQLKKYSQLIQMATEYEWHEKLSMGLVRYANRIMEDYTNGRETK